MLVNAAHLDRLKPLTARPTADYESASSVLELQAQCLAAAVEASVAQGLKPEGAEDWLAGAQQARASSSLFPSSSRRHVVDSSAPKVDARSRSAHRTLKKARESKRVLLDELNELDHVRPPIPSPPRVLPVARTLTLCAFPPRPQESSQRGESMRQHFVEIALA